MNRTQTRSRKHRADTPSTSPDRFLILVCAAAFAIRTAVAFSIGKLPLNRTPQYDALEYLMWAQRIAAGDFTWPANPPHGPAYPYFLGITLAIGGGSLMFARVVQAALGALTCWFAGRATGSLVPAAILAVYAPLAWLDVSIASEGLLVLLLAATFYSRDRPYRTGILAGLAILTRPTAVIFLPVFLKRQTALKSIAVIAAMVLPVTIANWRTSHAFIPVQAFGGMNIYLGNSPSRDGKASARPGGEWEKIEPQAARDGARTIPEEDSYFLRKTAQEITAQPFGYLKLLARKLFWTLQNEEVRDTHSFYFFAESSVLLRWLPRFAILFGLAVLALNFDRRIALFIALAAFSCVFLVVGTRYRMPLVLGLALECGSLLPPWPWKGGGKPPQSMLRIVIAVLAAALTLIGHDAASRNLSEEHALSATSLLKENDLTGASASAQRATQLDPTNALAFDVSGSIQAASGRYPEAEASFRRAVEMNPYFTNAHEHLGLLLAQMDDVPRAAAEYRTAVALDPRRVKALIGLARLEGASGRPAEGLQYAQRAAALQPLDDEGWLLIAMLAADTQRFDIAENALLHVGDAARASAVREAIRSRR